MIVRPERMDDREASLEVERAAFGRDEEAAAVLAVRDEAGAFAMIVLGDPAFSRRFGFVPAAGSGLVNPYAGVRQDGFTIAEEDFQLLALDDRAATLHGDVRWHPAFGEPPRE